MTLSVQQQAGLYKGGSTFSRLFCSTDGNSPPGNALGYHRLGIPSSKISYIANCSMWKSIATVEQSCSSLLKTFAVCTVAKPYYTGTLLLIHWKVLQLPINLQKTCWPWTLCYIRTVSLFTLHCKNHQLYM